MQKPIVALTMGDPAGVGPELMLQAMSSDRVRAACTPVLVGSHEILLACAKRLNLPVPAFDRIRPEQFTAQRATKPTIVDCGQAPANFQPCRIAAECGQASYDYIQCSIDAAIAGSVDAVTTGPINKAALNAAGISFPGHTEIFALRTQADRWCMMQYSPEITCTFVTVHCGYSEVSNLLSQQSVLDTIQLTDTALTKLHGRRPNMVVCGLNPHAGEGGLFGNREEERFIIPAIEQARATGSILTGPLPPDTAFLPARRKTTDAFICMYHDQGHIPLKALAFDSAVNTTLGLPIIRTSVDHGTAFDIAWQGIANDGSLMQAIDLAIKLAGPNGS